MEFDFSLRSNDDQESFWSEYAGSTMQKHWICPYCNEDILVTVAERVAHENQCQLNCKYSKNCLFINKNFLFSCSVM
jgi:hypothetical protein